MKRSPFSGSYFAPFALWQDLALRTTEMLVASAQVIGHRTQRMAAAGPAPSARDRREFALMGQEKIEAGVQSAQAVAVHMMRVNQASGAQAFGAMQRTAAAWAAVCASRTPAQLLARQAALAVALRQSAVSSANAATGAALLAQRALKPVHAKATANARRLAKR